MKHYSTYQSQFIEMFGDTPERVELSSLCYTFIDGDWIEAKDQAEDGIRLIQTGNVGVGVFKDKGDKARYISEDTFERLNCTEVKNGDILVSRLPDPVGRACIIPEGLGKTITAVDCTIIRLADKIVPKFFIAFTNTPDYAMQIKKVLSGTTRLRVSRANLGKIQVPLPAIQKQIEFVSIAEQADKSKFTSLKSQFIEMFNEKGYPLAMIKSFADVSTGGTPSKANPEYWNGDKPWVSAEDMKNKYVYDTLEKVTEAGYATCKIIPVDTLMYVCRGSIGVMAINKIECATNQSICRAKCHDNVCNVEFLYHALMYQRDNIKKMGTGTSFKSLNQTSFSELKIELPPYNEQMKFVSIAQQADKSKYIN